MEQDLKKIIEKSIDMALEYAYRRGYSHGYNFGSGNKENNPIMEKIILWKEDLSVMKGAPGSPFEDHEWKSTFTDIKSIDEFIDLTP